MTASIQQIQRAAFTLVAACLAVSCGSRTAVGDTPPPPHEKVYTTVEQALWRAFPEADGFATHRHILNRDVRARIERRIGFRLGDSIVTVYTAGTHSAVPGPDGYAMVVEEIGRYYPITFLVATDPAAHVRSVQVLVYRERHGDAVRRERFLKQFRGKGARDAIAVDRDIVHISGATMSAWAMAAGVRRAVATIGELYAPRGTAER